MLHLVTYPFIYAGNSSTQVDSSFTEHFVTEKFIAGLMEHGDDIKKGISRLGSSP